MKKGITLLNKASLRQNKTRKAVCIFLLLLFIVLVIGISYGYVSKIIESTKQSKISAGVLDLELFEGEELVIENLYPQANQVGLIQEESYDFKLINKTENDTKYILKLQRVATPDELNLTDVVYGLTKDNTSSTGLLSELEEGNYIVDSGTIKGNQTINYELRFWLREDIEDDMTTRNKTLKYSLRADVSQKIAGDPSSVEVKLFANENLGDNCKTYDDGVDTFLVGQCKQNYVWYSGKLWRVVLKNNETGAVKMVTDNEITTIPYNTHTVPYFSNSYMEQWLTQEFLPTLHDYQDYLVVDSIWNETENLSGTQTRPLYTSKVSSPVGLLNSYEHSTANNNSNGYLSNRVYWWLITPLSDKANIKIVGGIGFNSTVDALGVKPSVNVKPTIKIESGIGVQSNPYILESDTQETVNGTTLLSTRYSGEYVTFNNEIYRIVSIEGNLIKITAVDIPSELTSLAFDSNGSTNFTNSSIKTDLESYYQGLKTSNKDSFNMIQPDTIWYLGEIVWGGNYKKGICINVDKTKSMNECIDKTTNTTANIGLPRIGEMFTSQITRDKTLKFWTLTPYGYNNNMRYVSSTKNSIDYPTNSYSVRPSMYLKSNVVIAKDNTGNGTYEHPYSIELGA